MAELFGPHATLFWAAVLALLLFYPVRQLIWVLSVRRVERREGPTDEPRRQALKRRANVTAALLSIVFSYVYTVHIMPGR